MTLAAQVHRTAMARLLMAYAASYGVIGPLQRRVAARLWRALPRGLTPAQSLQWLDAQVSAWAYALTGVQYSEAAVRYAFLTHRLDPLALLGPHDGSARMTTLARQLQQSLAPALPALAPRPMPEQSLQPLPLFAPLQMQQRA